MAESKTLSRQRMLGGIGGVLLLVFALAYRFIPDVLHVERGASPSDSALVSSDSGDTMGFDRRNLPQFPAQPSAAVAGPPVSLASSDVIMAYRQAANAPVDAEVKAWLQHGDDAASAGRLVGGDDSAAYWYGKVLAANDDNRAARAGVAEVARRLASKAHKAISDGDLAQARKLLADLKEVPKADDDAARVQHQLEVLAQVSPLLSEAAGLLKNGQGLKPHDKNALLLYRKVLELDPENSVAQQGLLAIQRSELDRALAAVAQSDYAQADAALASAASIMPSSQGLQNTRSRVEGMRRLQAENVLQQAGTALDSGNLDIARSLADKAVDISSDLPGMDDFNERYRNARLYANHKPGQVFTDRLLDRAGRSPFMVVLPTGSFLMGSVDGEPGTRDEELPRHRVDIEVGIAMSRTEVTVAQFREFINASGYVTDAARLGTASVYEEKTGRMHSVRGVSWKNDYAGERAKDNVPVVNVSWNDADAYAKWLAQHTGKNYRLPSEAEFEYALRAGTTSPYWWGSGTPSSAVENLPGTKDSSPTGRKWNNAFADYGDGHWGPAPVMSFKPNAFGLYDMGGNVSEWVADCWHDNYTRALHNGNPWINPGCAVRVVRGGSWGSDPSQTRSAFRQAGKADIRGGRVGFRVLRVL